MCLFKTFLYILTFLIGGILIRKIYNIMRQHKKENKGYIESDHFEVKEK